MFAPRHLLNTCYALMHGHTRFDWNQARAFLVAAELGTFTAAAEALGVTQPTVGRQVTALEEELGVTLFERGHGRLELTLAGLELLEQARHMAKAAESFSLTAAGQAASIEGSVCITASELICAYLLPPVVVELRRRYPSIEVELLAANDARDLRRREADIAVRNFQPKGDELIGKKVRDAAARSYATHEYIERIGPFERPEDLAAAEFIAFDRTPMMLEGLRAIGVPVTRANFPVMCANHLVQWQLARAGAGICLVMEEVGDNTPGMQRVLPELPAFPVPLWLVTHREVRTSRRIRVVFDLLAELLATPAGA